MALLRPTQVAGGRVNRPWRVFTACLPLWLGVAVVLAAPGAADASPGRPRPGWSSAPRWRLPNARAPTCPEGMRHARGLTQVQKARCVETGPERHVAKARPRVRETSRPSAPASRPLPSVYDEPDRAPEPGPATPVRGGRIPTIGPGLDATALMRMDSAACHAYLDAREVPYVTVDRRQAPEVAIPVRLTGAVAGVEFMIPWSDDPGHDPHAVWDCRLVAAVVPVAEYLHEHGVTEVQYFSALRRGKIVRDKPRSQHNVGLALDLLGLRGPGMPLARVEDLYPRGRLRTCPDRAFAPGPAGAPVPVGAAAADLYLALVCQTHARGLFHTILTPDHDRAHHNHLHLDLKAAQASPADPFVSYDE